MTKKITAKATTAKIAESVGTVEAAVAVGKETVETVVKAGTDAAAKGVKKAVAMSQEQVAAAVKAGSEVFKGYEDVVGFSKQNIDAMVATNTVFVKGIQEINTQFFGLAKNSIEENAQATKKLLASTSVEDVIAIQSDLVKANYDKAVEQSRKISDLSVKVAEDAAAPITKQVNVTVEKFTKPLAA